MDAIIIDSVEYIHSNALRGVKHECHRIHHSKVIHAKYKEEQGSHANYMTPSPKQGALQEVEEKRYQLEGNQKDSHDQWCATGAIQKKPSPQNTRAVALDWE